MRGGGRVAWELGKSTVVCKPDNLEARKGALAHRYSLYRVGAAKWIAVLSFAVACWWLNSHVDRQAEHGLPAPAAEGRTVSNQSGRQFPQRF